MRPTLHPRLLNGRGGDPGVYLETLHLPDAVLLDCGDLSALSPRHLLRVGALGVSHAHMDHWAGFDRLLRLLIGREKRLPVVGPAGFAERLFHRLQAYTWNLADRIPTDLMFEVTEVTGTAAASWPRTRLRLHGGFRPEALPPAPVEADGTWLRLGPLKLRAAVLDHGTPSLGFAVEEAAHLNVWRTKLEERRLPVGPWLAALKSAVAENRPDGHPVPVFARSSEAHDAPALPLGVLRDLVEVTPGQRLAYLTDFADTPENRAVAVSLARGADILFIEAPFAADDAAIAADRRHLTTRAAGEIAREAGARRIEPFHFSPRYPGQEARLLAEVAEAAGRESLGGA
ncbi:MAG: Metal-dependent hydrolases of the beta-lactamase superfamily III [uncultured Acetobacteraceae bacterium]|uniref:Metal-dependent hydrolases of the beta-lactamase superfamily III n=1 Tax=uncultured Acetobacteraceae bacterium TaxID=169975 RepID=A0A6J4JCD7_9PROT|nr:MAG: Metal-dependent hydrolases of the beta-lactamase superfamily III [uncultured Acetobacteraceae bacterium]